MKYLQFPLEQQVGFATPSTKVALAIAQSQFIQSLNLVPKNASKSSIWLPSGSEQYFLV